MVQIEAGSKVKVTVTSDTLSDGAGKTLARLFLKDPKIAQTRRRRPKPVEKRSRAGRTWPVIAQGSRASRPRKGDSCELVCTLDVVRDLASVERFVEITSV